MARHEFNAVHREIHDQTIDIWGRPCKLSRRLEGAARNVYNETENQFADPVDIVAIIRFPDQAPLLDQPSLFVEEFLPIEGEFKYTDDIKLGDQIEGDFGHHLPTVSQRTLLEVVDTRVNTALNETSGVVWVLAPVRT